MVAYALLSLLMFAPGMIPGRTLSASDYLWMATPWEASRPADVPFLGSNREQTDAVTLFQPQLEMTAARFPDVPLWNPHVMGGRPYHANSQSAIFSPFTLPAAALPFWDALAPIAALKLFVAALGAFLLGRVLGLRFAAALLAGAIFGFSLWSVTWVSWTTMSVWAFLPWLCLLSELLVRRPGLLPFAGLAVVVALQFFGGHPASSFQVIVPVALCWLVRAAVVRPSDVRAVARRLAWYGAALAAGTLLAAVLLIPFVELLRTSIDFQQRAASPGHQAARYSLGVFLPDYWGRASHGTSLEFASALEERAYYVGALPLMLAAAALILHPRRERVVTAVIGLAAFAVALGIPPLFELVTHVPGFAGTNTWRLAVFTVLCGALLAGWGLQDIMGSPDPRRARAVVAACIVLLVLPLVVVVGSRAIELDRLADAARIAWPFASSAGDLARSDPAAFAGLVRFGAVLEWLTFAAGALVVVLLRWRGRLSASTFGALALVLVAADLLAAGMGYNPAIPQGHAEQPTTGAIRFLQSHRPARFAGLDPVAPISPVPPLPPNLAIRYGLYDARGYDIPIERRYASLWQGSVAGAPGCNYALCLVSAAARPEAMRILGVLGVRYFLQHRRDPRLPGLRLAYAGRDARIYENPHALPRAFLADRQAVADTEADAVAALSAPGFAARRVAVTERPLPGLERGARAAESDPGEARIAAYEPERVVVRTAVRRRSLLVLTDSWFPGWRATVDGRREPVHRVDHVLRGVLMTPGRHTVEFRYVPASWRAGWIVSLVALLAVLLAAGIGMRGRGRG